MVVQRLNGRVAMWAFAALALGEWQSGKTTLQQATEHPVAAVMFSLLISIASLAPKFAAGRSLSELSVRTTSLYAADWLPFATREIEDPAEVDAHTCS